MSEQDIGKDMQASYLEKSKQEKSGSSSRPRRFIAPCADVWKYLIVYFK
jgi:hypothetical protein